MKKIIYILIAFLLTISIQGCMGIGRTPEGLIKKDFSREPMPKEGSNNSVPSDESDGGNQNKISPRQSASLYFWDKENNRLVGETRNLLAIDRDSFIREMVLALIKGPSGGDLKAVMPAKTKINEIVQSGDIVYVNLTKEFLESEDLLVAYTALVNTLTEQEKIKYVKIDIDGHELTKDGSLEAQPLGVLTKSSNNINELLAAQNYSTNGDDIREINRELLFRDFRGRYLLPEIRAISVKNDSIATAIIEELIKGPVSNNEGLYSVIPQGTQLLDIKLSEEGERPKVIYLYFSKDLKSPFTGSEFPQNASIKEDSKEVLDKMEQIKNKEAIILSSIVYNLYNLYNTDGVKIFYEDENGNFIDDPLYGIDLKKPLGIRDFPNKLGRKIKVYFADSSSTHLVADYRAMSRKSAGITETIINELILGPREDSGQIGVIPSSINKGDIKVWIDTNNTTVMVDLPEGMDENKIGSAGALMTLYAVVNSLTDPVNTSNIKEVQFLIGGKTVKTFGNLEFSEPFIRNPAIIQE